MEWAEDARLAAGPEATCPTTPVVVTEVEELTTIRVPSGRLVVDAPCDDDV
ncbi:MULTISPECIES: hypothetical protein [unclassified Streptomyces]|uniref:Uncharacterized protein n=1 Tax=Streptomyces salinarius TaxID=2762598 RepID=A0ABW8BBH5_9ACTN|nr:MULTISPECIES: hypothetical protein [unclassified Streptomyces]NDZ73570.1 hypothetical protein [Streptomyces sp. SID10362]QUW88843.1 hypothetical protein KE639_00016 [Streptomyces sp. V17-9]WKX23274.1 hypothetical protein Q3Y68_36580 [Streptomyces sp. HUAS CX7]